MQVFAQMPTNGDYKNWKWENSSQENWKRLKNGSWKPIPPAFNSPTDKMNLIYEINRKQDFTFQKGWRLIHANFMGTFPYFILYNINNGVLRGFIYVEGDSGIPYANSIVMTVTPDSNLKSTKLLHLSESTQFAVNDKSKESLFSQNSITAVTTGGLNSWVALEIPLLFDNTITGLNSNWTFEFFAGTNSNISFSINGTSVPMDANGNTLFAHPDKLNNGLSLKAEYSKIHSNIKNFSEWGDKLSSHANNLETNDKSPHFLKKYKELSGKLGTTIKIAGAITQISSGIEVAMGIFDFFIGGSNSTSPLGYSHSFTGTGQISSLKYLRGNTMSVPGSANAQIPSWSYNSPLGIINLTNTPTVKKTTGYQNFYMLPSIWDKYFSLKHGETAFSVRKLGKGYSFTAHVNESWYSGISSSIKQYDCSFNKHPENISQYKLWSDIDLNIKSGIKVIDVKYAFISKETNQEKLINPKYFLAIFSFGKNWYDRKSVNTHSNNPIYDGLEKGRYVLYEFDKSKNTYIYGTPYMSITELKNTKFEATQNSNVYLAVLVTYSTEGNNEKQYFKGTYKINTISETLQTPIFIASEFSKANILTETYPAKTKYNYFQYNTKSIAFTDDDIVTKEEPLLYPNPTTGYMEFKQSNSNIDNSEITIYSISGKLIQSYKNIKNGNTIDLSSQAKGIYIAKIKTNNTEYTQKIILK